MKKLFCTIQVGGEACILNHRLLHKPIGMKISQPLIILGITILIALASLWYTSYDNDRQANSALVDSR